MEYLIFVKLYADNPNGSFEYELYYSEDPSAAWGLDWENNVPAICEDLTPDETFVSKIERVSLKYKLKTIQQTSCYSMDYATRRVVALSWIDIERLDEYPEEGRCVLHFGDSKEEVNEILQGIIL